MAVVIHLSPQEEANLIAEAKKKGMAPSAYARELVAKHTRPADNVSDSLGDFGGKSVADVMREIGFLKTSGPSDMARNPKKYMEGFGESHKRKDGST